MVEFCVALILTNKYFTLNTLKIGGLQYVHTKCYRHSLGLQRVDQLWEVLSDPDWSCIQYRSFHGEGWEASAMIPSPTPWISSSTKWQMLYNIIYYHHLSMHYLQENSLFWGHLFVIEWGPRPIMIMKAINGPRSYFCRVGIAIKINLN